MNKKDGTPITTKNHSWLILGVSVQVKKLLIIITLELGEIITMIIMIKRKIFLGDGDQWQALIHQITMLISITIVITIIILNQSSI